MANKKKQKEAGLWIIKKLTLLYLIKDGCLKVKLEEEKLNKWLMVNLNYIISKLNKLQPIFGFNGKIKIYL